MFLSDDETKGISYLAVFLALLLAIRVIFWICHTAHRSTTTTKSNATEYVSHDEFAGSTFTGVSGLVFIHSTTTAPVDDGLMFHFFPGSRDVLQDNLESMCLPAEGAFYPVIMGSRSGENTNVFVVMVVVEGEGSVLRLHGSRKIDCYAGATGIVHPM